MNNEKVQTGVIHFRGKDPRGGVTIKYEFELNKCLTILWSVCSPDDNYCRKTGVEVIESRLHQDNDRKICITVDESSENPDYFSELPSRKDIISELLIVLGMAFENELQDNGRVSTRHIAFDYVRVVRSVLESISIPGEPEEESIHELIDEDFERLDAIGYMNSNRPAKVAETELSVHPTTSLSNIAFINIPRLNPIIPKTN